MKRFGLLACLGCALALWWGNTSSRSSRTAEQRTLLAHRGIHQGYDRTNLKNDDCTATRMPTPTHGYLENTLASMKAAFEAGAEVVEIDIHPTTDGHFAVFHDWDLACRTNGKGVTREQSLTYLQSLDIGHGYTFDGGKSYPFRGHFVGAMPSLTQVLEAFPGERFLINIKSRDPSEGARLGAYLAKLPQERQRMLMVYGKMAAPIASLRETLPDMTVMSKEILLSCLGQYMATGWLGHVPEACHNTVVFVPFAYRKLLWGWPNRFVQRMGEHDAPVVLVGPFDSQSLSRGLDQVEQVDLLDEEYSGAIWTNAIEALGPHTRGARAGL